MSAPPLPVPFSPPRLLAFDLDGTLIIEQGLFVPDDSRAALTRLRAQGVKVAIVTGRDQPPPGVLEATRPDAVATHNGGRVEIGGELHSQLHFSSSELEAVLAHQLGGARVMAFTAEAVYIDTAPGMVVPDWLSRREHFPLAQAPRQAVTKIGFYHPGVASWRDELRSGDYGHLVYTGAQAPYPDFLTVTPGGADKGAALSIIAEQFGIPLAQVTVFGDSDNDEAMFMVAGRAVQVGDLPLLRPYAHDQVPGPEALGAYLHALADELERIGGLARPG
ncbi:HAD family hydrolase [Deinococcus sp.]|uniref:HAD family hydrolase n=1 Tax=Deinococcus sp. TaxID=47478 RepID=UPI0025FC9F1E|nr:HAD family hydrolase [Deinococcus sp.]